MRDADDFAIASGVSLLQMMENAGRALARVARQHIGMVPTRGKVLILAGRGGNGGGGMAAARRLTLWGERVTVHLAADRSRMSETARHQLDALVALGVDVRPPGVDVAAASGDVVVDALVGYSLRGAPTGEVSRIVGQANEAGRAGATIVALDTPTGMDPDSGLAHGEAVTAHSTVTLALPKLGLTTAQGGRLAGRVWLADISVPPSAFTRLGVYPGNLFGLSDLFELQGSGWHSAG